MAKPRRSCATKFLYLIAIIIFLIVVGAIAYRALEMHLFRWAMVPDAPFEEQTQAIDYNNQANWIARPDIADNPALWRPTWSAASTASGEAASSNNMAEAASEPVVQPDIPASEPNRASVFFIHPTSYTENSRWNAPIDDADSRHLAELFVRSQASVFNGLGRIWAPRYRQATFGAFLTDAPQAAQSLDLAYRDVLAAFEAFLAQSVPDRPIILAAHSQGSYHLLRLLRERIANTPVRDRIAAVYVVGWPIAMQADLPALPLPACQRAGDSRCILSWMSYADPADASLLTETWEAGAGFSGRSRRGDTILCVNPLSGNASDAVEATQNLGTLIPNADLTDAEYRTQAVPARCGDRGLLSIGGNPPALGPYVLPGNNYHVYDYALFWGNIRADAERRLAAFGARR